MCESIVRHETACRLSPTLSLRPCCSWEVQEWEWPRIRDCCSVAQSCWTLWNPMNCSTPGFPVLHHLLELAQTHVRWVSDAIPHTSHPLSSPSLLPSIFSSIRVFYNEAALLIRWPKFWSFSFSISPSNEYSGLISFRMDWFDLLAVQGTLKSLLLHYSLKTSFFCSQPSLWSNSHIHTWLLEKP